MDLNRGALTLPAFIKDNMSMIQLVSDLALLRLNDGQSIGDRMLKRSEFKSGMRSSIELRGLPHRQHLRCITDFISADHRLFPAQSMTC